MLMLLCTVVSIVHNPDEDPFGYAVYFRAGDGSYVYIDQLTESVAHAFRLGAHLNLCGEAIPPGAMGRPIKPASAEEAGVYA